ncbi:MAG: hypothetical protein AAF268_13395 [Cyanobacteria bacterium P01_A01_bin.3]
MHSHVAGCHNASIAIRAQPDPIAANSGDALGLNCTTIGTTLDPNDA